MDAYVIMIGTTEDGKQIPILVDNTGKMVVQ